MYNLVRTVHDNYDNMIKGSRARVALNGSLTTAAASAGLGKQTRRIVGQ
jgi:hypothetical protein